jgi:hypothetical protein
MLFGRGESYSSGASRYQKSVPGAPARRVRTCCGRSVASDRSLYKDLHARIIIMCPEIRLQLEAGYIYADCASSRKLFLQSGGGPYILTHYERVPLSSRLLSAELSLGKEHPHE